MHDVAIKELMGDLAANATYTPLLGSDPAAFVGSDPAVLRDRILLTGHWDRTLRAVGSGRLACGMDPPARLHLAMCWLIATREQTRLWARVCLNSGCFCPPRDAHYPGSPPADLKSPGRNGSPGRAGGWHYLGLKTFYLRAQGFHLKIYSHKDMHVPCMVTPTATTAATAAPRRPHSLT